jgi:redox-sensitive bicupin YhaK (pirin superfamily)
MCKPRYQDYQAEDIPTAEAGGAKVRVMAGSWQNTTGPIKMRNPGHLMDVQVLPGGKFTHE